MLDLGLAHQFNHDTQIFDERRLLLIFLRLHLCFVIICAIEYIVVLKVGTVLVAHFSLEPVVLNVGLGIILSWQLVGDSRSESLDLVAPSLGLLVF